MNQFFYNVACRRKLCKKKKKKKQNKNKNKTKQKKNEKGLTAILSVSPGNLVLTWRKLSIEVKLHTSCDGYTSLRFNICYLPAGRSVWWKTQGHLMRPFLKKFLQLLLCNLRFNGLEKAHREHIIDVELKWKLRLLFHCEQIAWENSGINERKFHRSV